MTTIDFNRECLPICRLVRITPEVTSVANLGFTDTDFDILYDGILYKSMPGFDISALDANVNLASNNAEIRVLIEDARITPRLIEAGFFEKAKVEILIVDMQDLTQDPYVIGVGELGQVSGTDTEYKIEMISLENRLDKTRTKKTAIFCDYDFGDSNCQLDLVASGLTLATDIAAKVDQYNYTLTAAPGFSASFGKLTFTSGELNGLTFDVFNQNGTNIQLYTELPIEPTIGDTVTLTAGCDKLSGTCKGYDNFVNFGGIPSGSNWIKGRDALYNPPITRA